jgi:hypothetical protein
MFCVVGVVKIGGQITMKKRFNFWLDEKNVEGLEKMLQGTKYNRSTWINEIIESAINANNLQVDNKVWAKEQIVEVIKILNRLASRLK